MDVLAMDASQRLVTLSPRDEALLRRCWHPVISVRALNESQSGCGPVATRLLDEALVVAVLGERTVAMRDSCGHKPYPLSRGRVGVSAHEVPALRCAYHGWAWNEAGRCIDLPSFPCPVTAAGLPPERVPVFEVQVAYGLVWVRLEPDLETVVPSIGADTTRYDVVDSWVCDVAIAQCLEWMARRAAYAHLVNGLSAPAGADAMNLLAVSLAPNESGYLLLCPTGWRTTTVYRLADAVHVQGAVGRPPGAALHVR